MPKIIGSLFAGFLVSFTAVIAMANPLPLPNPLPAPTEGAKTFPRVHFIEGADLRAYQENHPPYGNEDRGQTLKSFDDYAMKLNSSGRNRMGITLEASFKAQLDQYYRQYNPKQRYIQFVENLDINQYDNLIYGTYSMNNRMLITVTVKNLHTGETQSFETEDCTPQGAQRLAGHVFHEYQKTKFPSDLNMLGKPVRLLEKSVIYCPGSSPMWEMYKKARLACENMGGRLPSEKEISILGALGDYAGGVSLGHLSLPTYYWAIDHDYVYMAQVSQSTQATDLNPQEYLNYICIDLGEPDSPPPQPR
jgi:hypothetical protein